MKRYILQQLGFACLLGVAFWGCGGKDSSVSPQGTGGSMARFAITGNTLYIVSQQSLDVFDISQGDNPAKKQRQNIGVGIETIFPYGKYLFIGANDGMYIFDNADPGYPRQVSFYSHLQSCDPVVVNGKYAYVTLRSGSLCRNGNSLSSLEVIDVSNPRQPQLANTQPMSSPYGLAVGPGKLFVCEGDNGLKVMDLKDPVKPVLVNHYKTVHAYDVISRNDNHLIMTGDNGIFQYRYDEGNELQELSKIDIQ